MKRILTITSLLCIIASAWIWFSYQSSIDSTHISSESGPVVLVVKPGDSLNNVINKLLRRQAIDPTWFKILVKLEEAENKIQAGEYEFSTGTTPRQILDVLRLGKVNQYKVSIIEGQTFFQVIKQLHQHKVLKRTLPTNGTMREYAKQLGLSEENLEGSLMPETYFFVKGTRDKEIVLRAHKALRVFIKKAWEKREKNKHIKTPYEALILASIVERETAVADERKRIAGLFLSRLEIGMKLQTDPTVIYGMGSRYKGDIRFRDLRQDTPYNTYTRYGLPPTPIAMAGKASIDAVFHPNKTKSLYFVSRGDGTHVFSETLKQHNAAVDKYQ
ncbi:MAG: aminodeoxychorismate lyase [Cycloclasticus sp. symbiont of Poecilosclerida sp. M]|nr:MAG: aminodeoxychorismate lyase [Cycloclasticus sp. symbiont of Poecilosclerida sp. M]